MGSLANYKNGNIFRSTIIKFLFTFLDPNALKKNKEVLTVD